MMPPVKNPCIMTSYGGITRIRSVQRESNTHRISAALFGAFGLVVLALRRRIDKDNCAVWAEIRPSKPMRVRLPLD